jgi:hypothetical protein
MQPHPPEARPTGPGDFTVPRIAARTSGNSGFLFVNNHVREYPMPAHPGFQVTIKLPGGKSLTLPSQPVTLPPDAYFVWPFNLDLSGLRLRYATVQPLTILGTKESPVYTFFGQPGIPPEVVVDDAPGLKLDSNPASPSVKVTRSGGTLVLRKTEFAGTTLTRFILPGGKKVTVMLLEQRTAEDAWKIATGNQSYLLTTPQQAFIDGDVATLQDLADNSFIFEVLPSAPEVKSLDPGTGIVRLPDGGFTSAFSPKPKSAWQVLTSTQTRPASSPAPLPAGFKPSSRPRVVAAAPTDADWSRAATYSIPIPEFALADTPTETHFLRIAYTGDVARLSADNHLLDDNFADGRPWLVGLSRFAPQLAQAGNESGAKLTLSIYPLRPNPPIFFEPGYEPKPGASLESVQLLTQYTLKVELEPTEKR